MINERLKRLEAKNELAAFSKAIEEDLIVLIEKHIFPNIGDDPDWTYISSSQIINNAKKRFLEEYPEEDVRENVHRSIEFLDFADPFQILMSPNNKKLLPNEALLQLELIKRNWKQIIDTRNRASHAKRRLLEGQYSEMISIVLKLIEESPEIWNTLSSFYYSDPEEKLTFIKKHKEQIPEDDSLVITNLPLPVHNDTGFIGRKETIKLINKRLKQSNIVSILGEGGTGKTALAQEIGHIFYENETLFEQILYCSLKTEALDKNGLKQLRDDLPSMGMIFKEIDRDTWGTGDDDLKNILSMAPTLLIIDNLETIPDEVAINELRELQSIRASNSNQNTKILITSRRGLGVLEDPIKIKNLEKQEGVRLFREMLKVRQNELSKKDEKYLMDIVDKVESHPLSLWWIANRLEMGTPLENIMNNDMHQVVDYCIGTSIENLTDVEEIILRMIQRLDSARLPQLLNGLSIGDDQVEKITTDELQNIIRKFDLTSLISTKFNKNHQTIYSVTANVSKYLSNHYPREEISLRLKKAMNISIETPYSPWKREDDLFELKHFVPSSQEEYAYCTSLIQLINETGKLSRGDELISNSEAIRQKFDQIKEQSNYNFSEVFRLSAYFESQVDQFSDRADKDYIKAFSISEATDPKLCFWYSSFLAKANRYDEARKYIDRIIDKYPEHPKVIRVYARILFETGNKEEAIELLRTLLIEIEESESSSRELVLLMQDFMSFAIKRELHMKSEWPDSILIEKLFSEITFITNPNWGNRWDKWSCKGFAALLVDLIYEINKINQSQKHFEYSELVGALRGFPGKLSDDSSYGLKSIAREKGLKELVTVLEEISPSPKRYIGTIDYYDGKSIGYIKFKNDDNDFETISFKPYVFSGGQKKDIEKGRLVTFSLSNFIPDTSIGQLRAVAKASFYYPKDQRK